MQKQSPLITNKITKIEGPFENLGFKRKTVQKFRTIKRTETLFSTFQTVPMEHKVSKRINWTRVLYTVKIKRKKLGENWKSDQNRWNFAKPELRQPSLDTLNLYVISAGRDMVIDTDKSTTCRNKFGAPPLQRKKQKMKVLRKTCVSPNNQLNDWDQKF